MDELQRLPPPVSGRDVMRILRRRALIGLFTFALIVTATTLLTRRMLPIYETKARLLLDNNASPSMPSNVLDLLNRNTAPGGMETEIEKIRSRRFLNEVIRVAKLKDTSPEALQGQLTLNGVAGGEILEISVRSRSAQEAADTANAVGRVYIESARQEAGKKADLSTLKLRQARDMALEEKRRAEAAYNTFMKGIGVLDPAAAYSSRSIKTVSVRGDLEDARSDLAVQQKRRQKLIQQLNSLAPEIVTGYSLTKNPIIDSYRQQLYELRKKRGVTARDFQEGSWELQDIDNEIAQVETQIRRAEADRYSVGSKGVTRNPNYTAAYTQLIAADLAISTAQATIGQNTRLLAALMDEQRLLTGQKNQFEDLLRERVSAVAAYDRLRIGVEEARLKKLTSVAAIRFLDEARIPDVPVSPKPLLNLIMAIALGLFLGLGVMLLAEYLSATGGAPTAEEENRRYLPQLAGVPVLGMVPAAAAARALGTGEAGLPPAMLGQDSATIEDAFREVGYCLTHREPGSPVPVVLLAGMRSDDTTAGLAAQLSATLIRDGLRVTLVDADRAHPRLNRVFGAPDAPGLADVLAGRASVKEILHIGADGSLRFLAAGEPGDAAPMTEKGLRALLKDLAAEQDTDLVLVSGPSVWSVRAVAPLEKAADGMVLIAPLDTGADNVARVRRVLSNGYQPRLLGVVLSEGGSTAAAAPAALTTPVESKETI